MNEEEMEQKLARQKTREPTGRLDGRINALFEQASPEPTRTPAFQMPIWLGAVACLLFGGIGFFTGQAMGSLDVPSPNTGAEPATRIYIFQASPDNPIGTYDTTAEPEGFLMSPEKIEVTVINQSVSNQS